MWILKPSVFAQINLALLGEYESVINQSVLQGNIQLCFLNNIFAFQSIAFEEQY